MLHTHASHGCLGTAERSGSIINLTTNLTFAAAVFNKLPFIFMAVNMKMLLVNISVAILRPKQDTSPHIASEIT